jgi:hypothetical protein
MIETDRSRSDIERASIGVDYFQLLDFLISMKVDKTNAFDLRGNPYELKKRSTKASGEEKNLFLETRKRAIFQAKPIKKGMIKTGICFSGSKPCSSGPTVDCTLLLAKVGYRPDSFIKPGFSHGLVISILPLFGNTGPSAYQLIVIGISISWQQVSLLLRTN